MGLEGLLRRDDLVVKSGLVLVVGLAWTYTLSGAGMPEGPAAGGHAGMDMLAASPWTAGHAAVVFLMWFVMMVAMMLPSAAPAVLLFAALGRGRVMAAGATPVFVLGYLSVWGGFSLVAVLLQWQLEAAGLLSPSAGLANRLLAAGLLVAAGLYQLTPLKRACLAQCRSPAALLARYWRPGAGGAWTMGARHGLYCLGCCWFLMLLLFFGGVMNVVWIAALALYVLVEKLSRPGAWLSRAAGAALIVGGLLLAVLPSVWVAAS